MSIFGSILSKIFPSNHPAVATANAAPATPTAAPAAAAPSSSAAPAAPAPAASSTTKAPVVDVEQVLSGLAGQRSDKLNWRTSIVDLMKLLGLDSSLSARQQLARELHYTGDANDSASMNIWLHQQVMHKLEENGGKVPPDLKR